ncbi:MAG: helix-turn-helix domain-containing protein [Candidatus Bathyarchaeota archaeon]|nr:helix-turn-helix domain-containing protein [Candidatus Bathyarchaeota archaeon]
MERSKERERISQNEEVTATLRQLGLTFVQAKIYIALNQIGEETTIDTIAKTAKIARQHVYEPLKVLEKMSLVQRVVDVPPKYEVLPVKETLGILMELRKKENCELQKKIDFVIKNLQKNQTKKATPKK